ncbi:MAG: hypothetical protein U5P41_07210 [Gammaproteobacteria bacterium]|nr:hypothetical protein [Gammaproteobacteria bacterium]
MTDTRIGSIGIIGHGWLGRAMERTFPWARIYDAGRDNKDPRFDLWFTFIYPDARGCNSKCIAEGCPRLAGLGREQRLRSGADPGAAGFQCAAIPARP